MSRTTRIRACLLAVLPLLVAGGCEDSGLTAPSDGQIVLAAFPMAVVLDPGATPPVDSATVTLTAQVFDAQGFALQGVDVIFQTTGGTLDSAPPAGGSPVPVETDERGIALDRLTLTTNDPDSVDVTASSSTVAQTVTITKSIAAANTPPFASITATPPGFQLLGSPVNFNGSGSGDAEGDAITCYQWEINSSLPIVNPDLPCNPPNSRCEVVQGPTRTSVTRAYSSEQDLTVTLRVSANAGLACNTAGPREDEALFSSDIDVLFYEILCDATSPLAEAGAAVTTSLGGGPSVTVVLDGSASTDPESGITNYTWNCGNGSASQPGMLCAGSGLLACASCTYTTQGAYQATLTVNNGCGLQGSDTVAVTVNQ